MRKGTRANEKEGSMRGFKLVALVAVAALTAAACGGSSGDTDPAAFGDTDDLSTLCETAPVTVPGITILGQRIEQVSEVEVCVDVGVGAAGVPTIVNQPDCGDPCFTVEVRDLEVTADTGIVVNYKRDDVAQDPITFNPDGTGTGTETGRICVVGVGGPPDPCTDRITQPKDLNAHATTTAINLAWEESVDTGEDDVVGYHVWRSLTGEEGSFEVIGSPSSTSHIDGEVDNGQMYYYYVVAFDAEGNQSEASETVESTLAEEKKATSGNKKGKKGKKGKNDS